MAIDVGTELIERLAREFDELCNSRMQFGQEKYGEFTWLQAPTFDMMLEEMADWVNYTRMCAPDPSSAIASSALRRLFRRGDQRRGRVGYP
jgi:hypothetical protein